MATSDFQYGSAAEQFIRVHLPNQSTTNEKHPIAVIIHGGYWKNKYAMDSAACNSLAPDLKKRGYIAVELEYRRRDHVGGGWPGTNQDVAAGFEYIPTALLHLKLTYDPCTVVVFGHSAGGTMALWLAHHSFNSDKAKQKQLKPSLIVALAPITDLERAYREKLSDEGDAIELYMKCNPDSNPQAYAQASPIELLPVSTSVLVAYGCDDVDVPASQSTSYIEKALATPTQGCSVSIQELTATDHYDVVNAAHSAWQSICESVEENVKQQQQQQQQQQ